MMNTMRPVMELHEEWMKSPEYRKEYERLRPEFERERERIRACMHAEQKERTVQQIEIPLDVAALTG